MHRPFAPRLMMVLGVLAVLLALAGTEFARAAKQPAVTGLLEALDPATGDPVLVITGTRVNKFKQFTLLQNQVDTGIAVQLVTKTGKQIVLTLPGATAGVYELVLAQNANVQVTVPVEITLGRPFRSLIGPANGQVAAGDHDHDGDYSALGHDHDADYVDVTGDDMTGPLNITDNNATAFSVLQNLPSGIGATRPPAATIASDLGSGIEIIGTTLQVSHEHSSGVDNEHTVLDVSFNKQSGVGVLGTGVLIRTEGSSFTSSNVFTPLLVQDRGTSVARIDNDGAGYFNGGTFTTGADFAESVAVNRPVEDFEPGDVIVIDPNGRRRFALSQTADSPLVAGIYSTKPGILARPGPVAGKREWRKFEVPLAITGIVPCKVCDEGGPVRAGDLLVSASLAGHAKKAPKNPAAGTLVGKALEPLDGRAGKIEVLITMR